jgi:hypothetical protein
MVAARDESHLDEADKKGTSEEMVRRKWERYSGVFVPLETRLRLSRRRCLFPTLPGGL